MNTFVRVLINYVGYQKRAKNNNTTRSTNFSYKIFWKKGKKKNMQFMQLKNLF